MVGGRRCFNDPKNVLRNAAKFLAEAQDSHLPKSLATDQEFFAIFKLFKDESGRVERMMAAAAAARLRFYICYAVLKTKSRQSQTTSYQPKRHPLLHSKNLYFKNSFFIIHHMSLF